MLINWPRVIFLTQHGFWVMHQENITMVSVLRTHKKAKFNMVQFHCLLTVCIFSTDRFRNGNYYYLTIHSEADQSDGLKEHMSE